jgi:redox-sensitive bicupin YhaK (pirin superfamily)
MVGPFIFFDHMGPIEFKPNRKSDIRPHPHIGLSTLTYLVKGRMVHRDNLGSVQTILPGEVNWMTAGKGIVHSERAHPEDYGKSVAMEGLQFWVAIPDETEDQPPSFHHYEKSQIPVHEGEGFRAKIVVGSAYGLKSAVRATSPTILAEFTASAGANISFEPEDGDFELALYVLKGGVSYYKTLIPEGHLAILKSESVIEFTPTSNSHFVILGGAAFKTPRLIWWNFVSSTKEKIDAAREAWRNDTYPKIPGETERIPLGE